MLSIVFFSKLIRILKYSYSFYIQNKTIKYLNNKNKQERCYSRNVGIDSANGEIITFLDHDDQFKDCHLLNIKEAFEDNNIEMVYSVPEELIDYNGKIIGKSRISKIDNNDWALFAIGGYICNIGMAFKKEAICTETIQREDYELSCRAIVKFNLKIKVIQSNSIQIRRVKSPEPSFEFIQSINLHHPYMVYSKIVQKLVESYVIDADLPKTKYLPHCYLQLADTAITFKDYDCAWRMLIKSWFTYPFLFKNFKLSVKLMVKSKTVALS
jgi:glycosyltransferase involved in cell wall biosynthesis